MTTLEMRYLGGYSLLLDGKFIPDMKSVKGQALLCYLAVSGKRFTRSALAGMFWMDLPESQALMNLRKVLNRIKPISPHLLIEHESIAFNQNRSFWLDVNEFVAAAVSRDDIQRLQYSVSLYQGDFLAGFDSDDMPLFSGWMDSQRAAYRDTVIESLHKLIDHFKDQNDYRAAIHFTRQLLKIEAWNEEAHHELMRLLALSGQRSEAIKQYEMCLRILKEEMGIEPALSTIHLYQQILGDKLRGSSARISPTVPLKPSGIPHNLPAQMTSFIGRRKAIGELRRLLKGEKNRLITLTGPGGTGKTRLALKTAVELLGDFPDGVWLVELAPLADPHLVAQTVIAAIGQIEQPNKNPVVQLMDYLRQKKPLLILDNCEHLLTSCAELANGLLLNAPNLKILATSRENLGATGEIIFQVPSLEIPDLKSLSAPEDLTKFEAVQLIVERAEVVSPGFAITDDNATALAQITMHLDGIPLAIELAAARLREFSVRQIAERIPEAIRLLKSGSRTALPRHQTLKALIDWSYNRLTEQEQGLLRNLSIFSGGWTLEAADEVCGGVEGVLGHLGQLADKSLILAVPAVGGEMRYQMLEMIRQYGHAVLVEASEAEVIRGRHLAYFLGLAERLEPKLRSREQIHSLDYLEEELENLRLALEWGLQEDVESGLRLAAALQWFWHLHYHWSEGIAWLERMLEAEALSRGKRALSGRRGGMRAKALTVLGLHHEMLDPPPQANAIFLLEEAIKIYREIDTKNRQGLAWALVWLGDCKSNEGKQTETRILGEEALSLFRECGDQNGKADSLRILGYCEIDPARKKMIYQEMLSIDEAIGDIDGIATALCHIGITNCVDGDYEEACSAFEGSRERYRLVGNLDMVSFDGLWLSFAALLLGKVERSVQYLEEAHAEYPENTNDLRAAYDFWWKCMLAFREGNDDQIVEFNEAGRRIAQSTGNPMIAIYVLYSQARLARVRGDAETARRYAEEGLVLGRELGSLKILMLLELSYLALTEGDLPRAGSLCREGLQINPLFENMPYMIWVLDGLAVVAYREGKMERAARLFGTRHVRGIGFTLSPVECMEREGDFAAMRVALGSERYEELRTEGFGMTFMQVLALAQADG